MNRLKTPEFWLSLASAIAGGVVGAGLFAADSVAAKVLGAVIAALAALGYRTSAINRMLPPPGSPPPAPPQ